MNPAPVRILGVSDVVVPYIYSPQVGKRFKATDLIVGCGDLPYFYLEYIYNALDAPLLYVRGNHDKVVEFGRGTQRVAPEGGIDLHRRVLRCRGVLLAGIEGSLRYRPGPFQYSQTEMWLNAASLIPALWANRLRYGRFLDVLVSHAAPLGVHDQPDLPHQGIAALRWLDLVFQPRLHLHGHIHRIGPREPVESHLGATRVVNVYSFQELELARGSPPRG